MTATGNNTMETIEADVLVIGAGFAGYWAAIRARDLVDKVVLVDKGKAGRSGMSTLASGVQMCVLPGDNFDVAKKDLVEQSYYFADQDWIDVFLENQLHRVQDYINWGAPIERDEQGQVIRVKTRGHINTSVFMFRGREFMNTLARVAERKGIRIIDRVMVTNLLTSDGIYPTQGSIVGAIGLGTRTAQVYVFKARAIVLTTGGYQPLKANRVGTVTGDGQRMAFEAGAELQGLEFTIGLGNINCWERKGYAGGINMIQGYGCYMVNAKGERFMGKYAPFLKERARLWEMIMGYLKENIEGRGPVYIDVRHFPPETIELFRRVIPHPMRLWNKLSIDLSRDRIENSPAIAIYCIAGEGGVRVAQHCQTFLPGLYAAGATASNPIQLGSLALGGVATASCNVLGHVAGENAARWAREVGEVRPQNDQIKEIASQLTQPLQQKQGKTPNQLRFALLKKTVPAQYSLIKHEKRIRETLDAIRKIKEELDETLVPDPHELVKLHEMKALVFVSELALRGALEREESRAIHFREEYPYTDNINWLKHIVFRRFGHQIMMTYTPVVSEKWPYQPIRAKFSYPIPIHWSE